MAKYKSLSEVDKERLKELQTLNYEEIMEKRLKEFRDSKTPFIQYETKGDGFKRGLIIEQQGFNKLSTQAKDKLLKGGKYK